MDRARLLASATLIGSFSVPVLAQDRDTLELQFAGGYVWGGGVENPGPSLMTYNVGVAVWLSDHWGVAARHVGGPGTDPWSEPAVYYDRTVIGLGNLRYTTVTARRRWLTSDGLHVDIGFGLLFNGSYEFIERPGNRSQAGVFFGGASLEVFIGRRLSRHFRVKGGFTEDFNIETANTQLLGLAVVGF